MKSPKKNSDLPQDITKIKQKLSTERVRVSEYVKRQLCFSKRICILHRELGSGTRVLKQHTFNSNETIGFKCREDCENNEVLFKQLTDMSEKRQLSERTMSLTISMVMFRLGNSRQDKKGV